MIKSFACEDTRELFAGERVARFINIQTTAIRKLQLLHAAQTLSFLRKPPGNRLEPLQGDLKGYYSIRINDQWRLSFLWADGSVHQVQMDQFIKYKSLTIINGDKRWNEKYRLPIQV